MTAIAGIVARDGVWLAADSAGVSGTHLAHRADTKVFSLGEIAIAFTSSFRFGQLLQYQLKAPSPPVRHIHRWMSTTFVDAVRACLRTGGWLEKDKEREDAGTALVAVRRRLFVLEDDLQVAEHVDAFTAEGCGSDLMLGAMAAQDPGLPPGRRLRQALQIAARYSTGVCGPFRVLFQRARGR